MLDKTIKEVDSVDATIPKNGELHSTITEKLQEYTDLKQRLTNIWQRNTVCVVHTALFTKRVIQNNLHESLTLLILRPRLHILMKKQQYLIHAVYLGCFQQNYE
jgi:hypothetical protein